MRARICDVVGRVLLLPAHVVALELVLAGGPVWPLRAVAQCGLSARATFGWLTFAAAASPPQD